METVAHTPADDELRLLTEWRVPADRSRQQRAAVVSILVHVAAILTVLSLPPEVLAPRPQPAARRVTPLIEPLTDLTQTVPNQGKINKEFNAATIAPRPNIQIPPSPPSTTRPAAPRPSVPVPAPARPAPDPQLPEPPKLESTAAPPPKLVPDPTLPPRIQPEETKPRIAFENPKTQPPVQGAGGRVTAPNASVAEAIRGVVRGGTSGLAVGDPGTGIGGLGPGANLPPSPGQQGSNLELLSDPMGVDFRPYLIQVLAAVRRNWWAVMPEAARLGRRGKVGIQFAIARNGSVPKLVIVSNSGADALDRAAVAGVSASNPFPPLPAEFKGDQIRLQMNFAYNMPKQ